MGIKWNYTTSKEKAEAELKSENARLTAEVERLNRESSIFEARSESYGIEIIELKKEVRRVVERAEKSEAELEKLKAERDEKAAQVRRLVEAAKASADLMSELPTLNGFIGLAILEELKAALAEMESQHENRNSN